MAGDWIKWTKGLTRKPEVVQIAIKLGRSRQEVAGLLMEVWEWADENVVLNLSGSDPDKCPGVVPFTGATESLIVAVTGAAGLAEAMQKAGWLTVSGEKLTFPNFGRHNGKTAKSRALDSSRKARDRAGQMSGSEPDKNRTREEKKREEKSKKKTPLPPFEVPAVLDTKEFREVWGSWVEYRRASRKSMTDQTAKSQLKKLAEYGPAIAAKTIELSIQNGWQGLFPEKINAERNGTTQRGGPDSGGFSADVIANYRRPADIPDRSAGGKAKPNGHAQAVGPADGPGAAESSEGESGRPESDVSF